MSKPKRKKFFIKDNFQIAFIFSFIILLFIEIMAVALAIYKLSSRAVEEATFKSHITVDSGAQIIAPIITKINIYAISASVLISCIVMMIAYLKLRALLAKIINGLKNLRDNNTSFRITNYGRKNTRELVKEFNHAASWLDKRRLDMRDTVDSIIEEKELKHIEKLHHRLYSLVTNKS